jgi:UDP-glucose 4-epimerase
VDAFLRAGALEAADGKVMNLGADPPVSLLDLVEILVRVAGRGTYRVVPFPEERKRIDIGDFYADTSRVREVLGWEPRVPLEEGLRSTVEYYREHIGEYL